MLCVLTALVTIPLFLPLLRPSYSLGHKNTEIRPINNATLASKCPGERNSHRSLTTSVNTLMISKWNSLTAYVDKVLVVQTKDQNSYNIPESQSLI